MHHGARSKSLVRKLPAAMACLGHDDSKLLAKRACFTFFLARWRRELLIDETEGDIDAIERDRRMLDYYLDQYSQLKLREPVKSLPEPS
jgi:hypothetical protein